MDAAHQVFLDGQKTTTRCAFCKWRYAGTAADGRLEAERHRREEHPDRAPGGKLAEAFGRRKRRRTPWSKQEVVDAFLRFWNEHGRWPVPNDIPLVPYLPSMNTVQKVPGSWPKARALAEQALSGSLPPAEAETDGESTGLPAAREEPGERARRTVSPKTEKKAAARLRAALHELADAVADFAVESRA